MSNDTTRWVIIAGGDGYQTATVTGVAAMELAFLRAHEPDATLENPGEFGKSLLEHIRDDGEWSHCMGDRMHCEIRHEDGWVHVYRLTDDLVGVATHQVVRTADCWAREFRLWADHPAANGFVPVHPETLRRVAELLSAKGTEERKR